MGEANGDIGQVKEGMDAEGGIGGGGFEGEERLVRFGWRLGLGGEYLLTVLGMREAGLEIVGL